jgi:hypothetical protein
VTVTGLVVAALVVGAMLGVLRRAAMRRAYANGTGGGYSIWALWAAVCVLLGVGVATTYNSVTFNAWIADVIGGKR